MFDVAAYEIAIVQKCIYRASVALFLISMRVKRHSFRQPQVSVNVI